MTPQALIESLSETPPKLYEWRCEGLKTARDVVSFTKKDWVNVEFDLPILEAFDFQLQMHTLIKELIVTASPSLSALYSLRLSLSKRSVLIDESLGVLTAADSRQFARPVFLNSGSYLTPSLVCPTPLFDGNLALQKVCVEIYGWEVAESVRGVLLRDPVRSHILVAQEI